MTKRRTKPPWEMSSAELEESTRSFERPFAADASRPLTPSLRARWKSVKKRMGRPRRGEGSKLVAITIERGLLRKVDAYRRRKRMTRSATVAAGLQALLSEEKR